MKLKKLLLFILLLQCSTFFCQETNSKLNEKLLIEDKNGHLIQHLTKQKEFLKNREEKNKKEFLRLNKTAPNSKTGTPLQAVEMCTNGGFEQYENISGKSYLKNFLHTIGDPPGPTQCRSITNTADSYINSYNPNDMNIMATTVPANLMDPYLGDIKAFDQYALKINHENSSTYGSIVQSKRFKTNNENYLKFNYKAVLQSVYDNSHTDNQPFVKARILDKKGTVVNEFCMVGDEKNCIFKKAPSQTSGHVTLYTANWQSGILDISSIPNNEEFTVEFMASRCGLGGHFGYMYVDDICLLHSSENLQGSIELDPLYKVCPTLPITVCGNYTIPNSGGISATVEKITLTVYNSNNTAIYNTSTPLNLDTTNKKFCFSLKSTDFPNSTNANYNVGVQIDYDISGTSCSGTTFNSAIDSDANPGWDISFLNCTSTCDINVTTAKISQCDTNRDGSENFDLSKLNSLVVNSTTGLSFSYYKNYNDAEANLNAITNFTSYPSASASIFIRVSKSGTCYKIISANLEVRNPTANITGILNVCSGSTVLTASSGASYLWSTGEKTQSITITSIGNYSVTVTDSYGCNSNANVTIEPSQTAVLPILQVTQPSCLATTGSIKVISTASQFSFDDGATWTTSDTKTNLYPGTYLVKIKTVNGCISYAQSVTISAASTLYPYYTSVNPLYCGDKGSITITTPSAFYSFDDGMTWVNNSTASNLSPGNYKIRIKDSQGCTSSANNVLISSNTLDTPTYTSEKPACSDKGSITINTISDFYTFDGGQTWVTNNKISNLNSGSYSVGIKNALGCTSDFSYVYLTDFENSYPEYTVEQPVCGSDGKITITTVSDYYSFDNGITWTTNNVKTLPFGSYQIKVKNSAGCISYSYYVYLYEPYLTSPVFYIEQPTCGTNGKITINSLSDFYSFDNGVTWTTLNYKSLPPGVYKILIKNSIGCKSYPIAVFLNDPNITAPDYTVIQPTCNSSGSITINTPADFYSFDGGVTWGTTNKISNINSYGYYIISIKNSLGCTSNGISVPIKDPLLPAPDYTVVNPSCGNIGSITFNTSADFYSIDSGLTWNTNPVFNNLTFGYYGLIVKTSNCKSDYISVYLDSNSLAAPKYTLVQPTCGVKGSITITTPASLYSIDGQTWVTSPVFSNLSPRYYQPSIKNSQGCISSTNYANLQAFYLPNPIYTFTQPTCGSGGSITFTTSAAQYSIDGGTTWTTNSSFTNLKPGYYNLVVKNTSGCTSYPYNASINLNTYYLPNPDFTLIQPTCDNKGSITIATVANSYSFDGGSTWTSNPTLSGLSSGYYNIVIKNASGCISNYISLNITPYYLPNPSVKATQPSCGDGGNITINTPADNYSFDGGKTWTSNPILLNPASGSYYIVIKNANGCISNSLYYYINEFRLPQPNISTIQPTCSSPYGTIIINTPADQYSFDGGTTWTTNPIKKNLASGSYSVVIKNALGCISNSNYVYIYTSPIIPSAPTVKIVQPSTCGATDGSITITTTAQSYSFNDGNSWTTNPTKINVGAGTYIIKIKKDAYSCESVSTIVNLSSGTTIAAPTYTSTQPSCSSTKGSITITTNASTYSFDNGLTYVFSNTKTDLSPGVYYIKIKNSDGCISDATSVIISPLSPLAAPDFKVIQPNCTDFTASITINTIADYYSFDNGVTFGTINSKSNLSPGTYNLVVKYNSGCISLNSPVTIESAPSTPLAPQVVVNDPVGCDSSKGSITVSTVANLYSFDDGLTWNTNNTMMLAPGNYSIRIKYNNSCASIAYKATINTAPNAPSVPTLNITQPNSCSNPFGSISITSSAHMYSFDNGKNYSTNPISGNLTPGNYLIRIKNISGCESIAVPATINLPTDYPNKPSFNTIQPDCNNLKGSITITDSASEYSFDNGSTWTANATKTNLDPKTYYIKVKNSIGCISDASEVKLIPFTNFSPLPILNTPQSFCFEQNASVNSITIIGQSIKWYDSITNGSLLPNNTLLQDKKTYFASQTINGCESERIAVKVEIQNTPSPTGSTNQTFCSDDNQTLGNIVVIGNNIKWYDALIGGNNLPNNTKLIDGVTYYASQTINSCESNRLAIKVTVVKTPLAPTGNTNQRFCKSENASLNNLIIDGQNLKWYDSSTSIAPLPNNSLLQNNTTYYVTQTIGCESSKLAIFVNVYDTPLPKANVNQFFCIDEKATLSDVITIGQNIQWYDAPNGGNVLNETTPLENKTYYVTQTDNNCESNRLGIKITIQDTQPPVADLNQTFCEQQVATLEKIKISGQNIKWYNTIASGANLMASTLLQNGETYFASQTVNGCESERTSVTVTIQEATNPDCVNFDEDLPYPKFFTPNADGYNDTWTINFLYLAPNSTIRIFDRFGKLIKELLPNTSWDGTYHGQPLPSTDYWFAVTRLNGNEFKNHFSLKR